MWVLKHVRDLKQDILRTMDKRTMALTLGFVALSYAAIPLLYLYLRKQNKRLKDLEDSIDPDHSP